VNELSIPPGTLASLGLYAARCAALVVGAPLFGAATGFAVWRAALVVILAGVLYASGGAPLAFDPPPIEYGLLVLREIVLGLAMAFCFHGALLAVRTAAELVSHEIGLSYASVVDPSSGGSTSSLPLLYETFFYLGLLLTDGHHVLFRALHASFERAPIGVMRLDLACVETSLSIVCRMLAAGITFAVPVLVLLFVSSLVSAIIGRAVPHLNVNEMGFTLRTAVGLLALFFCAPLLAPALNGVYGELFAGMEDVVAHAGG
jgi:flagellar biosynthetic protein FliR